MHDRYIGLMIGLLLVGNVIVYMALRPSFYARSLPSIPAYTHTWPEYRAATEDFSVKFPPFVSATATKGGVVFSRGIAYEHADPCDFVGNAPPRHEIADIDITMRIINGGMKSAIDKALGHEGAWKDIVNERGEFVDTVFESELFHAGRYIGHKVSLSVEWCGTDYYFFETKKGRVIVASKSIRPDLLKDSEMYVRLTHELVPPPYSQEDSEKIVRDMMATFKENG